MREENKLIAEFMGFKIQDNPNERFYNQYFTEPNGTWGSRIEIMHFDSSWDWLMPVVKKLTSIFSNLDYEEREKAEDIFYIDNMFSEFLESDLKSIYERCIEFIKWYNENN